MNNLSCQPMTVDLSKIKAGDKVQLEFTTEESSGNLVFRVNKSGHRYFLDPSLNSRPMFTVVGHTPKPWVPVVGDPVRILSSSGGLEGTGYIMHIVDYGSQYMVEFVGSPNIWHKRLRSRIELIT